MCIYHVSIFTYIIYTHIDSEYIYIYMVVCLCTHTLHTFKYIYIYLYAHTRIFSLSLFSLLILIDWFWYCQGLLVRTSRQILSTTPAQCMWDLVPTCCDREKQQRDVEKEQFPIFHGLVKGNIHRKAMESMVFTRNWRVSSRLYIFPWRNVVTFRLSKHMRSWSTPLWTLRWSPTTQPSVPLELQHAGKFSCKDFAADADKTKQTSDVSIRNWGRMAVSAHFWFVSNIFQPGLWDIGMSPVLIWPSRAAWS